MLKPGSYFASYEWVSTEKYDPNDRDHTRIIDEINFGNGLPVQLQLLLSFNAILACLLKTGCDKLENNCVPFLSQEMRTYKQAEKAGKDCGFELVLSYDVATASPFCGPW